MNLFNWRKPDINSISIPDFGWDQSKSDDNAIRWINPEKTMMLSINFFSVAPNLPTAKDIERLRAYYRSELKSHEGGLLQVDLIDLKGFNTIKTIFKIPQEPSGVTYLSSLTIPFRKYSYVVKIQAPEVGVTGFRNSMIADELKRKKVTTVGEDGFDDWKADPYDPRITDGYLMDKSEDEQYDSRFTDHPLSQSRRLLKKIEAEIMFGSALEKLKTFDK